MIPCICIDDKSQPVPPHRRVKAGDEYRITHIYKMMNMGGILGCDIYEKPLGDDCGIFKHWRLSRFAVRPEYMDKLLELAKDCNIMLSGLNYHCSKCSNEFSLKEAITADGQISLEVKLPGIHLPVNKSLIHIVCPKCNTIVSSFHVPAATAKG